MKISVFIFLGFVVILVMFSITTYINFQLSEQVNANSEWFGKSTAFVRSGNRFQRNILNMVSGLRGYLFTGEQFFIEAYDSAVIENERLLIELKASLTEEHSPQIKIFQEIEELNRQWVQGYAAPLVNAKKQAQQSDSSYAAFDLLYRENLHSGYESQLINRLNARIRNFINYEYAVREQMKVDLSQSIADTRRTSVYLTSLSIITGLAVAAFLAQRISNRIMKMVEMANSIASGNYRVHADISGKDELSHLASSLNHMANVLSENISLLQRKNKELDQFAHIVSHDMKAPLRGIDNVITWIEEDHFHELTPKVKEYLGLIKSRIIRGENLIHGILSYSRVGQYEMERERVDLNVLLDEMRETLPLKPGLVLQIQKGMPVLYTHRVPLVQIFSNLINNAIKYHDKPDGYIKVYYREEGLHYRFYVEDNGPGIAENYHAKIFVIFQTLNGADAFESTGVGLAIVKKILDDKKQTIQLSSKPGEGSTFSFTWAKNEVDLNLN